ncbi:MAG: phosphoadenylyl-sulfate reductase [Candidatus Hydrogenedentes bacterium]|nr:phosphoadenylyl-sulfate reductase [Candidatus Hydrogenedentota bacterium]
MAVATHIRDEELANIDLDWLKSHDALELLSWTKTNFGERAAIFTSFQNTGCVTVDLACQSPGVLRVVTVDTLRLPSETYELMDVIEKHYGITIERFQPDPTRLKKMIAQHGEYLFFDSRPKQEYCCSIRKVEPNQRALQTVDVWISGLRRDQSSHREGVPKATLIQEEGREILKLNPLADWTEKQVRDYIAANAVPYNSLYDKGYTSIGCAICTTPTRPGEHPRAGRWRWFNALEGGHTKECGIHTAGSGI